MVSVIQGCGPQTTDPVDRTIDNYFKQELSDSTAFRGKWYIDSYMIYDINEKGELTGDSSIHISFPDSIILKNIGTVGQETKSDCYYLDFDAEETPDHMVIFYDKHYGQLRSYRKVDSSLFIGFKHSNPTENSNNGSSHALFLGEFQIKTWTPIYIRLECTSNYNFDSYPNNREVVVLVRKEFYDLNSEKYNLIRQK